MVHARSHCIVRAQSSEKYVCGAPKILCVLLNFVCEKEVKKKRETNKHILI